MLVYRGLEADTMNIYGVRNDGTWARFHGVVCSTANRSRDCISTMARKFIIRIMQMEIQKVKTHFLAGVSACKGLTNFISWRMRFWRLSM